MVCRMGFDVHRVHHGNWTGTDGSTRARRRRGLRKLSVEVHEDELRAIALKGYEGAATTDRRRQAEAVFFSSPAPILHSDFDLLAPLTTLAPHPLAFA